MRFCMDWRSINFDWNRARAFMVTAEEGSFSAAARALETTQPTVGRQVAALEAELQVALFERVGHSLSVTPTGLALLEHVRAMSQAATRFSLAAAGKSQSIDGDICITASEVISAYILPPIIADIRRLHPGITVEIIASNAPADLRRREADIAIRSFRPTQPELIARKVPTAQQARLYATPEYLASIGNPSTAAELATADFLGFDRTEALAKGLQAMGLPVTMENFTLLSESHLVQWELAKAGAGICIMVSELGDAEPAVVPVLADLAPIDVPMWLTTHREVNTSRRVRVVFDLLFDALSGAGQQASAPSD